jgi:hypothetical protein
LLSWSALENLRVAEMNDPDKMVARALDRREAGVLGVRQDWRWAGWPAHNLHWGLEYRDQDADYHYAGAASYDGLQAGLPRLQNPRAYTVIAAPEGYGASLYLSDRWNLNQSTWVQYGLRWDRQTWTGAEADDQISPRVSFLHSQDPKTDVRLIWGRYYQPQAIHHLQVEDDVDRFFAPQRSDHFILGFRREFSNGYRLRAEAFLKQYDRVKPRFENLFDPLALIPELAPDRVRLDPDSAKAKGFELTLEYRGRGELEWWMSYALSRATDRISGRNQARSWDQRHAIQTGASWQRGPWEIGAALSTHSGWPTTPLFTVYEPDQEEFIPIPGPRNSVRFRTFWTLDFRISREFEVKFGHLSAFLEVSNATNRDNPCCIDYDIDDEVDPATVDRSVDYWLPLIPAVGILWEF